MVRRRFPARQDDLEELGITSKIVRKKFRMKIAEEVNRISENPNDLAEWYAAHRREAPIILSGLLNFPRGTMYWLREKHPDWYIPFIGDNAGDLEQSFTWWVFPHLKIISGTFSGLWHSNAGAAAMIIIATILQFVLECFLLFLMLPFTPGTAEGWNTWLTVAAAGMIGGCINWVLFPIIPWFLCDLGWYIAVYLAPLGAVNSIGQAMKVLGQKSKRS